MIPYRPLCEFNQTLVHVSFDPVEAFFPRVPQEQATTGTEDKTIPRICCAPDIIHALNAMPNAGRVIKNMMGLGMDVILHIYEFHNIAPAAIHVPTPFEVPDVTDTQEIWITEPVSEHQIKRYDVKLTSVQLKPLKAETGEELLIIQRMTITKTDYQDNWEQFLNLTSKSEQIRERVRQIGAKYLFRSMMGSWTDEKIEILKTIKAEKEGD